MTYRLAFRTAARTAIEDLPRFEAFRFVSAWARAVDESALPAIAVATPREMPTRTAKGTVLRQVALHVIVRRAGRDDVIETILDDDSAAIETAVLTALQAHAAVFDAELGEVDIQLATEGELRIGSLNMRFDVYRMTEESLPLAGV